MQETENTEIKNKVRYYMYMYGDEGELILQPIYMIPTKGCRMAHFGNYHVQCSWRHLEDRLWEKTVSF